MAEKPSPTPRPTGSMTIGFGMVNVAVSYRSLVDNARPVPGKGLCPVHGDALKSVSLCSQGTGDEHVLANTDKLTAYPHPDDPGRLVVVDAEAVKSLSEARSKYGEITSVVDATSIDSAYTEKALLFWPQAGAEQAFDLLAAVLKAEGKAAIVEVVMYKQTEKLAVRWHEELGCLVGETIRFEQKIRHADAELVRRAAEERGEVDERMLAAAKPLLDAMGGVFDADEAQDTWTPLMQDAIRAADKGETFEAPAQPEAAPVIDLMEALRASVEAAKPKAEKPKGRKKVAA